jgi:ABC-type antimicrobial peptide transport system permease subunit
VEIFADQGKFSLIAPLQPAKSRDGLTFDKAEPGMKIQNLEVHELSCDSQALTASIEQELHSLAKDLPVPEVSTLADHHRRSYENERASAILTGCLSGMALFLAAVGLYGPISSSVKRRTREIGVRMALGARTTDVLRMVLRQSLRLVFGGACLGVVAALLLSRYLSSQLYGVTASDPWTYTAVIALIYAVVIAAALLPTRRASRVDPIIALHTE